MEDARAAANSAHLADAYFAAITGGDYDAARAIARSGLHAGVAPVTILTDVIGAAMRAVGDLWAAGDLTTADEHLATAITERVLADFYRALYVAPPLSRETVIAASVEGETHVLGTRIVADVLEGAGFRVVFLGGDLPTADLLGAIDRHRPAAVLLGATSSWADAALRTALGQIRAKHPDLPVLAGGPAAQALQAEHGEPLVVTDAAEVAAAVEAALVG